MVDRCPESFDKSVTLLAVSVATGANRQFPQAGLAPARALHLFTARRIIQASVPFPKSLYRARRVDPCRIVLIRRVSRGRIVKDRLKRDTRTTPEGVFRHRDTRERIPTWFEILRPAELREVRCS